MAYPPVIVVDHDDNETGLAMLAEVWGKGLYHRTVRIMVEDGAGNVLLQRRSDKMVIFPDCWDSAAAGHVDEGMSYRQAALQEVAEELGIQSAELTEMGYFRSEDDYHGKVMNQFSKVYRLGHSGQVVTNDAHEVSGFQWFSIEAAKRIAAEHPEQLTFGLYHVLTKLY